MARWGRAIMIPVIILVVVFAMLAAVARQNAALQRDQARAEATMRMTQPKNAPGACARSLMPEKELPA